MVIAYAGRRPGADFPEENVEDVGRRIEQVLAELRPRLVVGSAAAGADVLTLEAAGRAKVPARVILAGSSDSFRAGSVSDKGPEWERRFDAQLARPDVEVIEVPDDPDDPDAGYRAVTERISQAAEGELQGGEELVVLAVSTPRAEGMDHTEELAAHHEARGRRVIRIDPAEEVG